jgi:hypothetical protein
VAVCSVRAKVEHFSIEPETTADTLDSPTVPIKQGHSRRDTRVRKDETTDRSQPGIAEQAIDCVEFEHD